MKHPRQKAAEVIKNVAWRLSYISGCAALTALVVLSACARHASVAPEWAIEQVLRESQSAASLAKPKTVELYAEASANLVMVTVINHTDKPVLVGPKMFAVIVGTELHPVDPKDVIIQFPIRTLRREEGVSGTFQFRKLATVEGQKLVLKSPDADAQYVVINRYQPRQPNYRPEPTVADPRQMRILNREQERALRALKAELEKRQKSLR
ncbi:MAG: hypothetical protein N3D11_11665 [Candidatus Sumerlaeia bacterium]|nr:hypothetical protein [Candidatus Sumerlaeia bacterium]